MKFRCFSSIRSWLLIPLLTLSLAGAAQETDLRLLSEPLTFVGGEEVTVIDPTDNNIVHTVLAIDGRLSPRTPRLTPDEARRLRRRLRRHPEGVERDAETLAHCLLLTADARYALALDSVKQAARRQLAVDSLTRRAAACLLNSLSWIVSTDRHGAYVHLFEDCMVNVHTDRFRFMLDQIREGGITRYRITGLPDGNTPLTLRFRLPRAAGAAGAAAPPPVYYLNGRRLLNPAYDHGYLVVERAWRNGDELFFKE